MSSQPYWRQFPLSRVVGGARDAARCPHGMELWPQLLIVPDLGLVFSFKVHQKQQRLWLKAYSLVEINIPEYTMWSQRWIYSFCPGHLCGSPCHPALLLTVLMWQSHRGIPGSLFRQWLLCTGFPAARCSPGAQGSQAIVFSPVGQVFPNRLPKINISQRYRKTGPAFDS